RFTDRPRRLADANPNVTWPVELQEVLDRAMELDPGRRYPSASSFADAFASAVEDVPTTVSNVISTAATSQGAPPLTTVSAWPTRVGGLSAPEIAAIESRLAKAVGPIARVLVKRAAASATDRRALIAALAAEIDDPKAREQFERG